MFPHLSDSWLIILIACVFGFLFGQWIRTRRNRAMKDSDYVDGLKRRLLAEQSVQAKKGRKKTKKATRRKGGL
jgi:hypothetical protein